MDKIALIKELRQLTSAGMADCKAALEESEYDLDKAQDIVKARGLATVSRVSSKVASEGRLSVCADEGMALCVEINSQTDFVAGSPSFIDFCDDVEETLWKTDLLHFDGNLASLMVGEKSIEDLRQELISSCKENIVVRRWFREEACAENAKVFYYLHSNNKLAVLLSMEAPNKEASNSLPFYELGNNIAMQIAAMAPLALTAEQLSEEEKERQKAIFMVQLKEAGKPATQWEKILEGKTRKWYSEVCLLNQESVMTPKTTIQALLDQLSVKLCGEAGKVKVLNFQRIVVGEGIEKEKEEDYAAEISLMTGVISEPGHHEKGNGCCQGIKHTSLSKESN